MRMTDNESWSATLEGKAVLLADDGPATLELLAGILRQMGANVDTAEDGSQALELIWKRTYDLVIVDLRMPVLDGWAVMAALRETRPHLPIMAISGDGSQRTRQMCRHEGVHRFVAKPINVTEFFEAVCALIGQSNPTADSRPCASPETNGDTRCDGGYEANQLEQASDGLDRAEVPPSPSSDNRFEPLSLEQRQELGLPEDDDEYAELVTIFVDQLADQLAQMRCALQASNYEPLGDLAHTLKGTAPMFGYHAFRPLCMELEQLAHDGGPRERLGEILADLEEMAGQIIVPGRKPDGQPSLIALS